MKFLHTSDLHIGLRLGEVSLNGEIEEALDAIRALAVREGCDAVIVAGDIYDRAAPSADSVALFDRFVTGLAAAGVPILSVSGNHDSAERVGYLSSLLEKAGAHKVFMSGSGSTLIAMTKSKDTAGKIVAEFSKRFKTVKRIEILS